MSICVCLGYKNIDGKLHVEVLDSFTTIEKAEKYCSDKMNEDNCPYYLLQWQKSELY